MTTVERQPGLEQPAPAPRIADAFSDPGRVKIGTVGAVVLVALAGSLLNSPPRALVIALAAVAATGALAVAAPTIWRFARSHRLAATAGGALIVLAVIWLISGLERTSAAGFPTAMQPFMNFQSPNPFLRQEFLPAPSLPSWPWRIGRVSMLPLVLVVLSAGGGVVLLSDAVRLQLGLGTEPRTPWRALTATRSRGSRIAALVIPGIALIVVATVLAVSIAGRYTANHPGLTALAVIAIVSWSALLLASPLIVGVAMRVDLDKAGRAREDERRRFAAHLHDSVLQTLALIQRQAHDPAVVARLARRQEHALRAWMAGESDLNSNTVATAVREVVAEVEDEHEVVIQLTTIGDAAIDAHGEALVAAAREVLRNAARHAAGSPVFAFLDVTRERSELFIRDEGPGFDPDAVPAERRGLRDAVLGRMALAGGQATIESVIGEGTEVSLRIPHERRAK